MTNDFQTNKVYFSDGLCKYERLCLNLVNALHKAHVHFELLPHTESSLHIWARDFMPIQIAKDNFIGYSYNPDYLKDEPEYIPDIPSICHSLKLYIQDCGLVIDGGNVIKCEDKVILTEKVLLENCNMPGNKVLDILASVFQAEPVIIPWDRYEPYGHADGMVRFIENGRVLINNYVDFDKALRQRLLTALSPHFEVEELHYDKRKQHRFSWAYINFLQTSGNIFLPQFRKEEDERAMLQIQSLFPSSKIHPIYDCGELAIDGGCLNCVTWNVLADVEPWSNDDLP